MFVPRVLQLCKLRRVGSGWPHRPHGKKLKITPQKKKKKQPANKNRPGVKGPACGCQQAMTKQKVIPHAFSVGEPLPKKSDLGLELDRSSLPKLPFLSFWQHGDKKHLQHLFRSNALFLLLETSHVLVVQYFLQHLLGVRFF